MPVIFAVASSLSLYKIRHCISWFNLHSWCVGSGKVYRVVLSNGEVVTVKKLWGGSKKGEDEDLENGLGSGSVVDNGFEAEVETLGRIRHKNIVRLWCCCSTKTCELLVYEYMPNGSLGDLLHSTKSGLHGWPIRYKIAVDVAEGFAYLHHDCVPAIVHRDVKSNNFLLDGDFGARVADFGVAKLVNGDEKGEYAYTLRINEKCDIYSFGVVILELVTGKRPVDPEYGEKDLVKWVCTTLDKNTHRRIEIVQVMIITCHWFIFTAYLSISHTVCYISKF
ncbi:putative protein kinase RLK-Pelle-LRR-XI-1 family [Helianthus annuus]|nr:putative protein kinase RLK-Pelle-LRR-XI-1 family [Helianthus annuus]